MEIDFKVPTDWQVLEIREIGEVVTGRTPSTKREDFYGGQYKLISPNDLDNGKYVTTAHRWLTSAGFRECRALPRDTVLVGCIGNVGKLGMVQDAKAATNQQINAVICNQNNDPHFIYYSFYANRFRLERAADKTTVPILNKTNFEAFRIPVPSLQEQRKIAVVLGLVQRTIEQQRRLIALTTELKKALVQTLFTEGLRGEPQKQTEIGLVPQHWTISRLGEHAEFRNGINFSISQKGDIGIPTIDVLNMYGEGCVVALDSIYRVNKSIDPDYYLRNGDLLFVRSSLKLEGVGWTSMFENGSEPTTFCGFIIRARLKDNIAINPKFLTLYFRTEPARRQLVSGGARVAITNINQGLLQQTWIPVPSEEEQREIVDTIEEVNRKLAFHRRKKALLDELFKTLLHHLITANVRVNDLDLSRLLPK